MKPLLRGSRQEREWIKDVLSYDPGVRSKSVLLDLPRFQDVPDDNPLGVEVIAQEAAVATPKELLGTITAVRWHRAIPRSPSIPDRNSSVNM